MGFDPTRDLQRIGVVNQTTMLASETQAIADHLRQVMELRYGTEALKDHAADTRDTLCYATNDNQGATYGLLEERADLAIVVGGYNSSNTSHLVELCEERFPTYFISSEREIDGHTISHFDIHGHAMRRTEGFIPATRPLTIAITSGASCPDAVVDRVMLKIIALVDGAADPVAAIDALVG
jgi:4-hydroxy-3-methylbut-2-enyl diphosphate reductase